MIRNNMREIQGRSSCHHVTSRTSFYHGGSRMHVYGREVS